MTSHRTRERLLRRLKSQGISHPEVLRVIGSLPRHLFVDEALAHRAYEDTALPIGFKQTISQPYVVAKMTELMLLSMKHVDKEPKTATMLEIGTGSGYQTAVLSQLVRTVYSVERIQPLYEKTRKKMNQFGFRNVRLSCSDGFCGWLDKAPFDGILTCAAPDRVPVDLQEQLAPDGVLVIPVGADEQKLYVIQRKGDSNTFTRRTEDAVFFVPLLAGVSS